MVVVQREQVMGLRSPLFVPGRTSPLANATPAGMPLVDTGRVNFTSLEAQASPECKQLELNFLKF